MRITAVPTGPGTVTVEAALPPCPTCDTPVRDVVTLVDREDNFTLRVTLTPCGHRIRWLTTTARVTYTLEED